MASNAARTTPDTASGRDATVAALVASATRLFAERGPDAVSLRAVAADAGVNYGLIHQYVGSKDDLLRLVFRSVSEAAAHDVDASGGSDDVVAWFVRDEAGAYVSMLAWALLQGHDGADLLGRSPALTALASQAGPAADPDRRDAEIAAVTALALGWQLFGPFIRAGLGRDPDGDPELARRLREVAAELLGGRPSPR